MEGGGVSMRVYVYACECVCVHACVRACGRMCMRVYVCLCVCMCVFVCVEEKRFVFVQEGSVRTLRVRL